MTPKPRLDELLVQRGFFPDTHQAAAAILAGEVVVGQHRETSAGKRLSPDVPIRVKGSSRFVSRGGEKLQGALDAFSLDVTGLSCIDMGTSSGGFTDCLLQSGAARVSSVDVGYGQFVWTLRNDNRVSLFERTNVRGLDPASVGGPFDLVVGDLSFVSLVTLMSDIAALARPQGQFVLLIKPQFELDSALVGPGGVVTDPDAHAQAICGVVDAAASCGIVCKGLTNSPIKGPKGNIEYLFWGAKEGAPFSTCPFDEVDAVVNKAFSTLRGGDR